jgi:hypothetical protein
MIAQSGMPSKFVSASFIKPDNYTYVVGQTVVASLKKGDPLLWAEFMCPKVCGQRDGSGVQIESVHGSEGTIRLDENKIKRVIVDLVRDTGPKAAPDAKTGQGPGFGASSSGVRSP